MKILWYNDEFWIANPTGGAAIADASCIKEAPAGLDIVIGHSKNIATLNVYDYDLVVLSNNVRLPNDQGSSRSAHDIRLQLMSRPYICTVHDFMPWHPLVQTYPQMLRKAVCSLFKSPAHMERFTPFMPNGNGYVVPPYIGPEFTSTVPWEDRKGDICCVSVIYHLKGIDEIIRWAKDHPDRQVDFVSGGGEERLMAAIEMCPNTRWVGSANHENMPAVYNSYKYLIHTPRMPESAGLSVAEAKLCGCKLITNDKIGFQSYEWFDNDELLRYNTLNANKKFWETVCANLLRQTTF